MIIIKPYTPYNYYYLYSLYYDYIYFILLIFLPSVRLFVLVNVFSNKLKFSSNLSTRSFISTNCWSGFFILAKAFNNESPIESITVSWPSLKALADASFYIL